MIKRKTKAFTLLESIITIAILSTLLFFIYFNYMKYKENNSLFQAKLKIANTISKYRDLAYYNNTKYNIKFDFIAKDLYIYDISFNLISSFHLPNDLKYQIINKEQKPFNYITTINSTGNLSDAFTIYVFDYNDLARYRIAFYTFSQIKYLVVNIYKNHSADTAIFSNIYNYHFTADGENHVGWTKE